MSQNLYFYLNKLFITKYFFQIQPANQLPTYTKKNGGKIVIVNLQKTNLDKKADLVIHGFVIVILHFFKLIFTDFR